MPKRGADRHNSSYLTSAAGLYPLYYRTSSLFIHEMDSQLRDLLISTDEALTVIKTLDPTDAAELRSLTEGLGSLQDTILASGEISNPTLPPFYMLCHLLCKDFAKQLSGSQTNRPSLGDIAVVAYNLSEFQKSLLALFHALSTFLNTLRQYVCEAWDLEILYAEISN
jgi:hypothetical protein